MIIPVHFYICHIDFSPHVILILNTEQTSEGLELGMMYSHGTYSWLYNMHHWTLMNTQSSIFNHIIHTCQDGHSFSYSSSSSLSSAVTWSSSGCPFSHSWPEWEHLQASVQLRCCLRQEQCPQAWWCWCQAEPVHFQTTARINGPPLTRAMRWWDIRGSFQSTVPDTGLVICSCSMLAQRILARRKGAGLRRARAEHLVSHFVDRCGGVEAVYTASELLDAGENFSW